MLCGYLKNLLMIGLITIVTSAYGQSESFVIECKVSGEFLNQRATTKITNQVITVSVTSTPPEGSVKVEGTGSLNIGLITNKFAIFDSELISVSSVMKNESLTTYTRISINRITGFIDIFYNNRDPIVNYHGTTTVSGFCSKVSNKPKF
jgi:hypothetical protein